MSEYPNARDCEHGQLARVCEVCELQARLAECERSNEKCMRESEDAVATIAAANKAVIDSLRAQLTETQTKFIHANLEILRQKEYLRDHVHRLNVWIAETREKLGK